MITSASFQFYPDDFIAGTSHFSARECGVYIRLLCFQWDTGGVPADETRQFAIAAARNHADKEAVRFVVREKFILGADGNLRNRRMEIVRFKADQWIEKSRLGGKASGGSRTGKSEWGKNLALQRTISEPLANQTTNHQSTKSEPNREATTEPLTNSPVPEPVPLPIPFGEGSPPNPPSWEMALKWLNGWRRDGATYTEKEARFAFLSLQASGWMWGKNPATDPRAALESRIQSERKKDESMIRERPELKSINHDVEALDREIERLRMEENQ